MKTIGLLGGMSWESTIPYYRLINEGIKARLGGLHSASLLLHSVDFHEIEACQSSVDWQRAGEILAQAIAGRPERFDLMDNLPVPPFPGGAHLRSPLLVLAMTWYALRDRLRL